MAGDKDDQDDGRTMIMRPKPGGGRRPAAPAPPTQVFDNTQIPPPVTRAAAPRTSPAPRQAATPVSLRSLTGRGINPLVQAATPLLMLAAQLRDLVSPPDVESLQHQSTQEVREFEQRARDAGCAPEVVVTARYVLCTFLDEFAMNTPWGERSGWRQRSLLVIFHRETWGGEKFFQILDRASQDPARHIDVLELIYICLSLGFAGKYHVEERGPAQLDDISRALYQRIAGVRGSFEKGLSPNWQGVQDQRNPIVRYIPLWVVAAAAAVLIVGAFIFLYARLAKLAEPVEAKLATLGLESVVVASAPVPPPSERKSLKKLLAQDEAIGTLGVDELADRNVVSVSGTVFSSGSTNIDPRFADTLKRIGAALNEVPGRVVITGHTDDQPIRSLKYRDNYELSRERAKSFAALLGASMQQPSRLEWNGVGPSQPRCLPENLPENRACNRRVEVVHFPEAAR